MGLADLALVVDVVAIRLLIFHDRLNVAIQSLGGLDAMGNGFACVAVALVLGSDDIALEAIASDTPFANIHTPIDELHVPMVIQNAANLGPVVGFELREIDTFLFQCFLHSLDFQLMIGVLPREDGLYSTVGWDGRPGVWSYLNDVERGVLRVDDMRIPACSQAWLFTSTSGSSIRYGDK